jgi:subtilisin
MRIRLWLCLILLMPLACHDLADTTAPAEPAFSRGGGDMVDVIVVLDESIAAGRGEANRERARQFAEGLGLAPSHTYGTALFGFAATVPAARLQDLRNHPRIAHVELDGRVSLPEPVFDARSSGSIGAGAQTTSGTQTVPWGVHRTGALQSGSTGAGVNVYILDTGIDPGHPDLQANLGDGFTAFSCKGNPKNCPGWADDHGHGTHVAGTVAARDNGIGVVGVAPEATLHAVKVLSADGSGSWSGIIAGIDWVAGHNPGRPRVANMSLGSNWGRRVKVGSCGPNGLVGSSDAVHSAMCNAMIAGVVFTVSAGNGGDDAAFRGPAGFFDVSIAVSAASCSFNTADMVQSCLTGSEAFTTWSSWGNDHVAGWTPEGSLPVAIAAPGASVLSTTRGGGYGSMSGTSMAAPHVAGGAALILQQLGSAQAADRSAFTAVRAALLGAAECTATWHNISGNPHSERFLNLRSAAPIDECVEPGEPPPAPLARPTNARAETITSSTIQLAWDYPSTDVRFEIDQEHVGHVAYVEGTTYTVEGLAAGSNYRFVVRAVTENAVSGWSNIISAQTLPSDTGNPPIAAFSVSCGNSNSCTFSNTSSGQFGSASWNWDFGNGMTSTAMHAGVTYTVPGAYAVSLRVTDVFGRTDAASAQITCAIRGNQLRCS